MQARLWRPPPLARRLTGAAITVVGTGLAVAALVPARSSIAVDTASLVLVVPVAVGVAIGGFPVAPVGIVVGFLSFDYFFIPPYGTLRVGAGEHWVSLAVYASVALVVGAVVAQLQNARGVAEQRESEVRILYELAQAVGGADGLEAALKAVARLASELFDLATVAVLLEEAGGGLRVVAGEGTPLPERDVRQLALAHPMGEFGAVPGAPGLVAGALPTASGPAGVLALTLPSPVPSTSRPIGVSVDPDPAWLRLMSLFATQAGIAVERARLAEETTRARTLVEVDRLRAALVGAVSHDLRTPLASIKASVSDLADPSVRLAAEDRRVLLTTIEEETDRLTRFVSNLLDMSRIESGSLQPHRAATPLDELVEQVLVRFGSLLRGPISIQLPDDLPLVDIDYLLIEQVVANLVENIVRHCPPGTAIEISARSIGEWVEVRVSDDGPGIPAAERQRIFTLFHRLGPPGGVGTGMGLAICRGVVEAHGGQIWVEQGTGRGSAFVFRLPVAPVPGPDAEDRHRAGIAR